jgi:hypothetical protein
MAQDDTPGVLGCNEGLGPLPETSYTLASGGSFTWARGWDEQQMRAYAKQERAAERASVAHLDDGEAWSFCRTVMSDGRDIRQWHPDEGYEMQSARMDAQAAHRGRQLMAMVRALVDERLTHDQACALHTMLDHYGRDPRMLCLVELLPANMRRDFEA